MKPDRMTRIALAGLGWLALAGGPAAAEEGHPGKPVDGLHGSVGLGIGSRPAYDGSNERQTRLMPVVNLFYGDTLFLTGMTAGANVLKYKSAQGLGITAGPLLALRQGRKEGDNAALRGLGDIDRSLDAGGFVRLRMGGWQVRADVRKDVSNGDGGTTVNLSGGFGLPLSEQLRLNASLDASWASSAYMATFYGVSAQQSAASGIAQYDAGSGLRSVGTRLAANYAINRSWGAFASVRYKHLVGKAADSPIVATLGNENQVTTSVGINYRF